MGQTRWHGARGHLRRIFSVLGALSGTETGLWVTFKPEYWVRQLPQCVRKRVFVSLLRSQNALRRGAKHSRFIFQSSS